MNEQVNQNLPAIQEANAIANAAEADAGFEKLLKFKKGVYVCDGEDVPLGSQYVAHCVGWTKCWIKFHDGKVVERRTYPVITGKVPPDREQLDELALDSTGAPLPADHQPGWEPGLDGRPADPWVYQHLLPLENEQNELVLFVTSSVGGKRAVADLCKTYARRTSRIGNSEQPVIKLSKAIMPSKKFGDVPRPDFEIVGWDTRREGIRTVNAPDTLRDEMDDEIPY